MTVAQDAASGASEFLLVDPATLVVGANARLDARLNKDFIRSIRARGVLEPVVVYRGDDGALVVLFGQRRTLAAVQAGRDSVPVVVVPRPEDPDRIIDQVTENDHREGLRVGERVAAYEQLTAFGVTAGQIAKQTARARSEVDQALSVAGSKLARRAVDRWAFLTLEQAAAVAEFEGDDEAVKQLVGAARHGGFAHVVQRLRDARDEAAAKAEAVRALEAGGVRVVERPAWDDAVAKPLSRLAHEGVDLSEDGHAGCPGHAAFVEARWIHPDVPSDEDAVPDGDGSDAEVESAADQGEPAEPYRGWVPVFVCTDFPANGHSLRWQDSQPGSGRVKAAQMSDQEREQARQRRRDVIASNKDWDSAQTVRRRWLRTFLARRTAPTAAAAFIAGSLAAADHELTQALSGGHQLAHELFGVGDQAPAVGRDSSALIGLAGGVTAGRAQLVALGLLLAAYEEATGRHSWREARESTSRYLRFLEANGYELSAVELRACLPEDASTGEPLAAA